MTTNTHIVYALTPPAFGPRPNTHPSKPGLRLQILKGFSPPGLGVVTRPTAYTGELRPDCASNHERLGTDETIATYPKQAFSHPCRAGMIWVFGFH